jgi:hypothetical protein
MGHRVISKIDPILNWILKRSRLAVRILCGKFATAMLTTNLAAQVPDLDLRHSRARGARTGKERTTGHFTSPFVNQVARLAIIQNASQFAKTHRNPVNPRGQNDPRARVSRVGG